jgi:glycosyltransferase involved in cell wall biosynthesis
MTTISVAMATYNGARYVGEQLASIAEQTRRPDELIISDDNSTDATRDIIQHFAATSPFKVRLLLNEERLGSTGNFGRAVRECSGDVIALCDQDDVWLPEKLALIESAFEDESLGLVFSNAEVVDEQLRPIGYSLWEAIGFDGQSQRLVRSGSAYDFMLARGLVTGATAAFRSEFKPLILPFPGDLPGCIHDRWAALVIAAVSGIDFIDRQLILYRQHGGQQMGGRRTTVGFEIHGRVTSRHADLLSDRRVLDALTTRLAAHPEWTANPAFIEAIEARRAHLDVRLRLPASRLGRLRPIWGELRSARYRRCSSGLLSAIKDLVL